MTPRLPWPAPALLVWAAAWSLFVALQAVAPAAVALGAGCALGFAASLWSAGWLRRLVIAAGFPLSVAISGAAVWPAWAWLIALGSLLLLYPLHAWRDAPLFPTPRGALHGLAVAAPLPAGACVLDAGCGLGDGLIGLRAAYPQARWHGLEWSWPLRALCALRCPWARVRQGDIWAADWSGYALVYLFQRPESMGRAAAKASAEMAPGSWLVSLEFRVPGALPSGQLRSEGGRAVWIYRVEPALAKATLMETN